MVEEKTLTSKLKSLDVLIIKKDGTEEKYNIEKVIKAVNKSAIRTMVKFTDDEIYNICKTVNKTVRATGCDKIEVTIMHNIVEKVLQDINPEVAESYRNYRNYKTDFVHMLDKVYQESQKIMYLGDKSNANADSSLVTTKRSLIFNELSKELYKKFFLNKDELQAINDGMIYIHDISARLLTTNCCLVDMKAILKGGFELANVWYSEPKSLETAFGVISDVVLSASGNQYGGFSVCCIDELLEPYAKKTLDRQYNKYIELGLSEEKAKEQSWRDLERVAEQGFQEWEMKWNTLSSARGDFSFITTSFGLGKSKISKMLSKKIMETRKNGQGKVGFKKPVLFPKLIFLYDENLHGEGKELEDVFNSAVECSKKTMYPDYISLSGKNYVGQIYQQYGKPITAMGCVEGNEIITYTINGNLFVESFKRMWDRITSIKTHSGQNDDNDVNRYVDLRDLDVKIFDTKLNNFTKVNGLIRNLQNNWCNVSISNGRNVQVTTDHPFETENRGVVLAKDLEKGDVIKLQTSQFNKEEISINTSLAWLYGAMLCDGCYSDHSIFASFAYEGEDDVIKAFCDGFKDNFGVEPVLIEQDRGKKGHYYDVRVYNNSVAPLSKLEALFLKKFGGLQKIYRQIPNEVFSYTRECKLAFLAGMIDSDGYINNSSRHAYSTVQIGSTNKELAIQQMLLAQSLGMYAKMYHNHYDSKDRNKIRYRVEFYPTLELIQSLKCQKKIDKFTAFDYTNKIEQGTIRKVEFLDDIEQYSYDVTTESEHFEFSGIYSHNCRSFLSPWYEKGGLKPVDDNDKPIYEGRGNVGVISLNLPMIYMKAKQENKDFYVVLDYYLEMIRQLHLRTIDYLGEMKASCNPLMYTQGGFFGGNLHPDDKIKPVLKSFTTSFGITALNELQRLYNKKSIKEDGEFALEVMQYIANRVDEFKAEDGVLHSCYGTPAESLCATQVEQFKLKYGVIENVSDKDFFSNSFHCHVSEDITPIEKQDLEGRFIDLCKGGQIYFNRFNCDYNTEAFKSLIRRAMKKGFYFGTNLNLSYCEDCGNEAIEMTECPKCGSKNITSINRVCGYLGFSKIKGDTRFNKGKLAEVKERVSY